MVYAEREIWVTACHVAGKNNTQADRASRHFDDNTEWMLRQDIFLSITQLWGKPEIDLFASRLNAQLPCYASWKPDPGASFTDALQMLLQSLRLTTVSMHSPHLA